MDPRNNMDGFDMNAYAGQQQQPPPQIFGAYDHNGSPMTNLTYQGAYFGDGMDGLDDNDPKRRRIARVCALPSPTPPADTS